jgi:hypothetical protein
MGTREMDPPTLKVETHELRSVWKNYPIPASAQGQRLPIYPENSEKGMQQMFPYSGKVLRTTKEKTRQEMGTVHPARNCDSHSSKLASLS